jgi:hypothetical protein
MRKLLQLVIAGLVAVSFSAFAADSDKDKDVKAGTTDKSKQSGQTKKAAPAAGSTSGMTERPAPSAAPAPSPAPATAPVDTPKKAD